MAGLSLLIRRGVRDPRLRFLLVLLLLLLALALAFHLVVMADHTMMMLGACVALLAAAILVITVPFEFVPIPAWSERGSQIDPPRLIITRGRHPPQEGTVLLD